MLGKGRESAWIHSVHARVHVPSGSVRAREGADGIRRGAYCPERWQRVRREQGTRASEYVGGLFALLPLGSAVLKPDLEAEREKERKRDEDEVNQ